MHAHSAPLHHSVEYLPPGDLMPYEANARTHSAEQVAQVVASIREFGFTNPILIDASNGVIAGHCRLIAAGELGLQQVPCIRLPHLTETQRRAYVLADNKLALNAGWDNALLLTELAALDAAGFELDLTGFVQEELEGLMLDGFGGGAAAARASLAALFGAPPFTVLDTRQGYWQTRRATWLQLTGNLTATKERVLTEGRHELVAEINEGSSNFDPVLAELMMRWFCPPGGKVLDPFGGEQTKGVVAGELGLRYHGCELRAEQVAVDRQACAQYPRVTYACGDSEAIADTTQEREFDLCFTSPPYYDLEVYSAADMSAMGTYADFMAKYERVFAACVGMLRQHAFLVVKLAEIRDKASGYYRNFIGDNVECMRRLGLRYYNELVLVNSCGTAPRRAANNFTTRKMVRVHQQVLVFVKGDPAAATQQCGPLQAMVFDTEPEAVQ